MVRIAKLLAVVLTIVFALAALAGEAKKDEKKDAKKAPAAKEAGKKDAAKKDEMVCCTPKGKKFHASKECTALKNSKEVSEMSKKDAEKKGLEPCKLCCGDKKDKKKGDAKKDSKEKMDEKKK